MDAVGVLTTCCLHDPPPSHTCPLVHHLLLGVVVGDLDVTVKAEVAEGAQLGVLTHVCLTNVRVDQGVQAVKQLL